MSNTAGAHGGPHDYLICATHRSGSSLLCELLRGTGVAGRPREHITRLVPHGGFDNELQCEILGLLPPSPPMPGAPPGADLVRWARSHVGRDSIFGTKIMWPNLAALGQRMGLKPGAELLRLLTPGLLCVHIVRPSKVAQAVSYWAAMQTRSWFWDQPPQREPVYHFAAVDHLVRALEGHDSSWRALFAAAGVTPHTLTYDQLAADPTDTVRGVLRYIGVASGVVVPPARMQRQGGGWTAEWIARYYRDSQHGDSQS